MAEQKFKITFTVSGRRDLNELIEKMNSGTATFAEWEKFVKNYRGFVKSEFMPGTKDAMIASGELVKILDQKNKLFGSLQSSNAKMMRSYFETGEAIRRRLLPMMGSLGNLIETMPTSITGVTNSLQSLVIQMARLHAGGFTTQQILAGLGQTLMGPTGIVLALGLVTAAVGLLSRAFSDANKETMQVKTSIADLIDKLYELGRVTHEQRIRELEARKAALESELRMAPKIKVTGAEFPLGITGPAVPRLDVEIRRAARDIQGEILHIETQIAAVKKKQADEEEKQTGARKKALEQLRETWEKHMQIVAVQKQLAPERILRGREAVAFARPFFGETLTGRLAEETPLSPARIVQGRKALEGVTAELGNAWSKSDMLVQGMKAGFSDATGYLAEGFQRAFGLGEGLLARFVSAFAGAFLSAGAGKLVGAIFGLQHGGMISEPVVGMGMRSRAIYTLAERGPEYVTPAYRVGQAARLGQQFEFQPSIQVVPIIDNAGLAVRVEIGNRQNARRRVR